MLLMCVIRSVLLLALLELGEVAIGAVVGKEEHTDAKNEDKARGPDERGAPGTVVAETAHLQGLEHVGVQDLCDTTAEVTPTGGGGVRNADAVQVEHGCCP